MKTITRILIALLISANGCDTSHQRALGDQDQLAVAGVPGSVTDVESAEQDSTPLVTRRVWAGANPFVSVFPDGRYLAHAGGRSLWVRDLATGESHRVTSKSDRGAQYSSVSPDGERIAYASWNEAGRIELRVIDTDGLHPRVLFGDESVTWLAPYDWSPDGGYVLAHFTGEERGSEIVLVSATDGAVRVVKASEEGGPTRLSFSPDGKYIASDWLEDRGSPRDIFAISVDGGREIPLVQHPADDMLLGWAPDGEHVLFASDRTGIVGAWLLPVADGRPNGEPWLVKPELWRVLPVGFTPSGSYFYAVRTSAWDIYIAELDAGTGALVEAPTPATGRYVGGNGEPEWSPDGRHLAWRSQRGDRPQEGVFMIRSMETGETRELDPGFKEMNRYCWSPDGRSLLVRARGEAPGWSLFKVDLQTADAEPLVEVDSYEGRWADWSADAKSIYYSVESYDREDPQPPRIVMRNLESGIEEVVYRAPQPALMTPGNVALSPDRQTLGVVLWQKDMTKGGSLMTVPVAGGVAREVHRFEPGAANPRNLSWTPDGRHLVYIVEDAGGLWRQPVDGGAPERLEWEGMEKQLDIKPHPDGRRIAFTAGGYAFEVWVMEDFLPSSPRTEDSE